MDTQVIGRFGKRRLNRIELFCQGCAARMLCMETQILKRPGERRINRTELFLARGVRPKCCAWKNKFLEDLANGI